MNKKAVGWTIFLILVAGIAGASIWFSKKTQPTAVNDTMFPTELVLNIRCINNGKDTVNFWLEGVQHKVTPKQSKPAPTKKPAPGGAKPGANAAKKEKFGGEGPEVVEAGKSVVLVTAPSFQTGSTTQNIVVAVGKSAGQKDKSIVKTITGDQALDPQNSFVNVTWDGSNLVFGGTAPK